MNNKTADEVVDKLSKMNTMLIELKEKLALLETAALPDSERFEKMIDILNEISDLNESTEGVVRESK